MARQRAISGRRFSIECFPGTTKAIVTAGPEIATTAIPERRRDPRNVVAIGAAAALGGFRGLVNNAGIYQPSTLMETDAALFERHMRINQPGCFLGMKAAVPLMEQSGGGSIVNVSSVAGLRSSPGAIAYSATKWALRGMTKPSAIDLAPRRIRVNSIHPWPIDTGMLKGGATLKLVRP